MPELFGWTGKVLYINLTDKSSAILNPPEKIYHEFIGGKGMAGWYLRPWCTRSWDSPEMPLIFFTGPLVGTESPTSGRFTVMSMSPLTGTVGDSSAGGKFGTEMKRAGWDGIVISGAGPSLCGVSIRDGEVEFLDADHLHGKTISEVFASLPEKGSTAAVGPAAENGVLFANISFDGHSFAGRNGLGLVMAAKGLKYIHVEGSGKTKVFNSDELSAAREDIFRLVAASPVLKGELGISEFGTGALYDLMHSRRMMPTDNFRETQFSHAEEMNAWNYKNKYETKKTGCSGCHILCKKNSKDGEPIPEFETMSHFSALIGNTEIEKVMEASHICNEAGMDSITAASTIACYMEINKITPGNLNLLNILEDISLSRGEGETLKLGSFKYSSLTGNSHSSMSVKGLELPAYDPRGAYGMALAYATSTRGGCHLRAYPISHEILRKPVATDRFSFSGKARIIKLAEDMNAVIDSLTACKFIFFGASLEEYSKVFRAVTGVDIFGSDLMAAGERIYYNERIMNSLNGFSSLDDDLPERFFTSEGTSGNGISIPALNRDEFLETRRKYYRIRGLSPEGKPTKEKSGELGLEWTN
ncbi:MAG TPA: aldehyde ferredoxin oxidoreductase family protein [Spirochaetota bacterium]|nr:aldehyde ferredoxin oxidoreductase family protein [Spirochaetota bacterium]